MFTSCDDYLDTSNYTEKNTANYPQTLVDAQQVITGIYNNLNVVCANPQKSFFYASELAADDRLGGGGDNDNLMQALDLLMNYNSNMLEQFWSDRYVGVFRANTAIETLGNCTGYDSDDQKNQMMGESYFLRAFYYYELASLFGNVPLVITTEAVNLPKASAAEEWGQIIQDLKTAIELMPAKKYNTGWIEEGHVDRWCAEALMARAFLFYTGYYQVDDIVLPDGTTKVTKDDVIGWIDDCVENSGYSLVSDYRNLWAYTNRLTVDDYDYTKGQGLTWVENDNGINSESMFEIKFSQLASWSTTIGYANGYALHFGMRGGQDYGNTFPFGQGWGAGPVAPNLWDDWKTAEPNDMRRAASICNIPDELPDYTKGGWADFVQETDYYEKKMSPITCKNSASTSGYRATFEYDMYSGFSSDNMQLNNIHDMVLIRFADVLLMQSELKQDITGINKVRTRAGLDLITSYSDAALQNERRWELCFEGVRWNDIRRWHIAETALAEQINQPTYHAGIPDKNASQGVGYVTRYKETGGFFKIPENQISLSNGVLIQNDGWDTSDSNYTSWTATGR